MRRPRSLATSLALTALLVGCSGAGPGSPSGSASATNLTIYAAASLRVAMDELSAAYAVTAPDVHLTVSTDSSAALETKIEQGAPVDVFLSADRTNPQELVDAGLADGTVVTFTANRLVVIVPGDNSARISSPRDLARRGIKVIAAGDSVPITKYANQVVAALAKQQGYPGDFVARYEENVVSKEDNVAAVVAKIGLGEGDAGIVYETDARTSTELVTVAIPRTANVVAMYGGLVLAGSPHLDAARAFLRWLMDPEAQGILRSLGYLPPP